MPHEYSYSEPENILYVRSYGAAELPGIAELMQRIAEDARVDRTTRVLVDARELDLDLPSRELEEIADWHASPLGGGRTTAVVIRAGLGYGLVRMLSALADGRGVELAAFTDYEDALAWLHTRSGAPERP